MAHRAAVTGQAVLAL